MTTKEIIDEIVSLPLKDRVEIADSIIHSIDDHVSEYEKEWIETAKRRLDEIKSGKVEPIPGEWVMQKIQERFSLVEGIINSLDEPDQTLDEIWAVEAGKRLEAYRAGELDGIPMEEIFRDDE